MIAIKEFFERNKPVFTIGFVTFAVFVLIIIVSFARENESPDLIRLKDKDTRLIPDIEEPTNTSEETENGLLIDGSGTAPDTPSFDERIGIIEVSYYEKWGFVPKNLSGLNGQLVKWTNKSEIDITLTQKMPTYPELEEQEPITIKPGETFEFRLREEGLWTYEEGTTKHFGSINVKPNLIP